MKKLLSVIVLLFLLSTIMSCATIKGVFKKNVIETEGITIAECLEKDGEVISVNGVQLCDCEGIFIQIKNPQVEKHTEDEGYWYGYYIYHRGGVDTVFHQTYYPYFHATNYVRDGITCKGIHYPGHTIAVYFEYRDKASQPTFLKNLENDVHNISIN